MRDIDPETWNREVQQFEESIRKIAVDARDEGHWPGTLLNVLNAVSHIAAECKARAPGSDLEELELRVLRVFFGAAATAARDVVSHASTFVNLNMEIRSVCDDLVSSIGKKGS